MGERVELEVGFDDKFSGPSKRAGNAAEHLLHTMNRLARASGLGGVFATGPVSRFGSMLQSVKGRLGGFANAVGEFGKNAFSSLMSLAGPAILGGIAAITAGLLAMTAAFTKSVLSAGILRERATLALSKLSANGAMSMERLKAISLATGTTIEDSFEGIAAFMRAGFNADESEHMFKRMQDLSAVGIGEEQRKRAVIAIGQIKSAGMLQGDELNQLAEAGVGKAQVITQIAKILGKSNEEAAKLVLQGGKINSEVALKAIDMAMAEMAGGGPAGAAREEFLASTLAGAAERTKSLWSNALDDIAKAAAPAFKEISQSVASISDALQSGDFQAAKYMIADIFSAAAPIVSSITKLIFAFAGGLGEVMGVTGPGAVDSIESLAKVLDSPAFRDFARIMGMSFGFIVTGAATVLPYLAKLAEYISRAVTWVWSLGDGFRALNGGLLGANLATAFTDGILGVFSASFGAVQSSIRAMLTPDIGSLMPSLGGGGLLAGAGAQDTGAGGGWSPLGGFQLPSLSSLLGASMAPPTTSSQGGGGGQVSITQQFSAVVGQTAEQLWPQLAGNVRRETQSVIRSMGGL